MANRHPQLCCDWMCQVSVSVEQEQEHTKKDCASIHGTAVIYYRNFASLVFMPAAFAQEQIVGVSLSLHITKAVYLCMTT